MSNPTESISPSAPEANTLETHDPDMDKVELSIQLDPDLFRQVSYLTDNPSKVIEVALRQWLRGGARRDDDLTRNLERNPPVPIRGEWND